MKYNDNGTYKDIYVKTFDTLPVGTEVDYDGSVVPDGWSEIQDYSTSEIDTGKVWIDGKTIYRKSGSYTYSSTGLVAVETISNIDNIINLYGFLNTGSWQYPANSSNGTSSDFQYLFMNGGTIHFNSVHTGTLLYVIEYTKN